METVSTAERYDVFKQSCPSRPVFDRLGERWTGLVLLALRGGTMRFNELRRRIEGVSQKMLTQTLRGLERDGLVVRTVHPEDGRLVLLSLSPKGARLMEHLFPAFNAEEAYVVTGLREHEVADLADQLRHIVGHLESSSLERQQALRVDEAAEA